ncbi:hypothetical protein N7448_009871 [Penicillium atrosanguineum]|nr:hypothetical protein N7448_009871 [Penicillium atrosanguineum]
MIQTKLTTMTITKTDLGQHNSRKSCWVAIYGSVYDVTEFLNNHPGGANVILRYAGKDATDGFNSVHSPDVLEDLPETSLRGQIDVAELGSCKEANESSDKTSKTRTSGPPHLSTLINLHDFQEVAQQYLPANAWAYYFSGADDEVSKRENAHAYQKVALRPRILKKVPNVDTKASILGHSVSLPVYMSPVGIGKLAHPDGECALASAAGKEGLVQVLANGASMPIERVMQSRVSSEQPLFFQLYVNKDIKKSVEVVKRAEKAGAQAIWITVDSPVVGKREMDERLNVTVVPNDSNAQGQGVAKVMASSISPYIDWEILTWLRNLTNLPVVIKGIQCVEDAVLAYQNGVQGIVLSNHGGRSQDTAQSPLLTLLEIRKFAPHLIHSSMQIFIDGGIRRGTDVLKAIALGATAVGLGRPFLFSMSAGYGENGVRRMVEILRQEIEANMVFLGATSLSELRPEMALIKGDRIGLCSSRVYNTFLRFHPHVSLGQLPTPAQRPPTRGFIFGEVSERYECGIPRRERLQLLSPRKTRIMPDQIDVLLYGLGAIGSFYAFILSRSHHVRLTVVARSNYEAVNANGITIDSENHGKHTFHPYRVVRSPSEASTVDYVVCAHKAIDQEDVAVQLKPVVDQSRTTIVIIQNGVGNEEAFRKQFPGSSILTCVTWVGATQISPGIVKHTKSEDMQIGLFPNRQVEGVTDQRRLDTFAGLLRNGETRFQILEDIQKKRWEKVVWNVAWNSITALTMVDTQTWLHSSDYAEPFTRELMLEVIHIARGCGVALNNELPDQFIGKIKAMPGIGSSMQTDCKNGRPMEIDVILGFPVRKSRELGIKAPYLESLYVILRAIDGRLRTAL